MMITHGTITGIEQHQPNVVQVRISNMVELQYGAPEARASSSNEELVPAVVPASPQPGDNLYLNVTALPGDFTYGQQVVITIAPA